jgi:predicted outer membrane protein
MRTLHTLLITAGAWTTIAALPSTQSTPSKTGTPPTQEKTVDPKDKVPFPDRTSTADDAQPENSILATWLLMENETEIALAQLAQERAQDPEVKQFAQKMIDDHRQMMQKLQPFAPPSYTSVVNPGSDPFSTTTRPGETAPVRKPTDIAERPATPGTETPGQDKGHPESASAGRTPTQQLGYVALLQDLGKQCYSTARQELEKKQGAEFDRCFMGMAIGGHMKVNDEMTVFQRYSEGELKNVIAEGQRTVSMHLQHAKDLAKRLQDKEKSAVRESPSQG